MFAPVAEHEHIQLDSFPFFAVSECVIIQTMGFLGSTMIGFIEKWYKCKVGVFQLASHQKEPQSFSFYFKSAYFLSMFHLSQWQRSTFDLWVCFCFLRQTKKVHTNTTGAFVEVLEFNSTYSVEVAACTQAGSGMVSPRVLLFVPENSKPLWQAISSSYCVGNV